MGITLTLAELKKYFKIWHEDNFNEFHRTAIMNLIDEYLVSHGFVTKINTITNIQTGIINVAKFLSKSINGNSNLTNSSSISDAISELSNIDVNLSIVNLKALNTKIDNNNNTLTNLINNKADKQTVEDEIRNIKALSGAVPKELLVQNIPSGADLNNYTTPGLYRSATADNTQGLKHRPESANLPFILAVIPHADYSVRQILLTGDSTNDGNRIYMRNYMYSKNSWGNVIDNGWYELYGTHNTTPLQMKIEWSEEAGGGSRVYTLLQR